MILGMTRIMPAFLIALAATPAAAAERRYTVTDFDRVQVDGGFEVQLATGRSSSAMASGSPAALDRVTIEVQGRTLRIRPNRSGWGGYPGANPGPVRILLTAHSIKGASVGGSGSLTIDKASAMRFDLALSGTGSIELGRVEADNVVLGLLGSGRIKLAGKAKSLRATVQGAGNLEAQGLSVEDAQINADTAGAIGVAVRRAATVTSTGQGETRIAGKPACTVKQLGAGQVFCGQSD